MTERQEKFENDLLECQKEISEKPHIIQICETVKLLIKKYVADLSDSENLQEKCLEIMIDVISSIKMDMLKQKERWVCGHSHRSFQREAERKMRIVFRENKNELTELIMSCTKDAELTARQQTIIRLAWNLIGWPISQTRGSKLKRYLSN